MPKFTIEHPHSLPATEVKQRLDKLSERLSTKYGIDAKWSSDTRATFNRAGASGSIVCEPNKVSVNVDLTFMLSAMKGQIESRIRDELAKALA
jgi:putative polyhydroxyalkanoate system protein